MAERRYHRTGKFEEHASYETQIKITSPKDLCSLTAYFNSNQKAGRLSRDVFQRSDLAQMFFAVFNKFDFPLPMLMLEESEEYGLQGEYIPKEENLPDRVSLFPVIALGLGDDTPETMIPYVLAHEFMHAVQDVRKGAEKSRLVPMVRSGIIYNPTFKFGNLDDFTTAYTAMEAACDIVSLVINYEAISEIGEDQYRDFIIYNHLGYLASAVRSAYDFASNAGLEHRDVCNFACYFASQFVFNEMKGNHYYADHKRWAKNAFFETNQVSDRFAEVGELANNSFGAGKAIFDFHFDMLPTDYAGFFERYNAKGLARALKKTLVYNASTSRGYVHMNAL